MLNITSKSIRYLILVIVVTIPLLFGAVHPVILGMYVFIMLIGCGSWLVVSADEDLLRFPNIWLAIPLTLIAYIVLQSIPLPLDIVNILSPGRAERISMLNELAGTGIAKTTISDENNAGIFKSIFLISVILYYYCLKRLLNTNNRFAQKIATCLILIGSFEAFYGILQFINPQIGLLWLPVDFRAAHGTIIYKNQYASCLNMIWPLAIVMSASNFIVNDKRNAFGSNTSRKSRKKVVASSNNMFAPLFFGAGVLMILAVLFSLSRGGILSMILVGILLIVLLPFSRKFKIIFFAVLTLTLTSYVYMLGFDVVVARFGGLGRSDTGRLDIYIASLSILRDHLLTGIGVDSYNLLSPVYLKGFPENLHFDRVHNEYLEVLIELGILFGALFIGWILAGMVRMLWYLRSASSDVNAEMQHIAVGVAAYCGIIGFLVHGLVDFGWRIPVNIIYVTTLIALFFYYTENRLKVTQCEC